MNFLQRNSDLPLNAIQLQDHKKINHNLTSTEKLFIQNNKNQLIKCFNSIKKLTKIKHRPFRKIKLRFQNQEIILKIIKDQIQKIKNNKLGMIAMILKKNLKN